ncbi:ABC transporter substrate-binding protein [Paenibacillus sp. HN-1]|nr:ABC transporter substrate-binding protein [Paenibacillus sp. CGMCC 1.18879]MBY9078347.1 ABC transporter substrate-binding protein [Paenibacillus sp. CGMCC 1.18879]MBY9083159.1 ABC transporter substrate-binding protein [Paenibacillus sinensis]
MRKKVVFSRLLLAMTMATSFMLTACSSNGNNEAASSSSPTTSAAAETNAKPVELKVAIPIFRTEPKDLRVVETELNKLLIDKINATISFVPISYGNWNQQMNLMLSSQEPLDLTVVLNYSSLIAKGQLLDITDLLTKYGSDITSTLGQDYVNAAKVDGKIYGVAGLHDMASSAGVVLRKDIAEKNKIDLSSIKTLADLEPALKTIKENEPGMAGISPGGVGFTFIDTMFPVDNLGDGFGVLPNYDNGLKVVNKYEMPEYADMLKLLHKWYQEGYILKDAATTQTTTGDLERADKLFASTAKMKPDFDVQESISTGKDMASVELVQPVSTTEGVTGALWGVPYYSKNAEQAIKFLNLLFTDKEIVNLIDWGIEGTHYVKVPGQEDMIDYPEGVDASTSAYSHGLQFLMGNEFLSYVRKGQSPDLWKQTDEFNKSAIKSKALGFTFNAEAVKAEITAVTNVTNQYKRTLETGTIDPEKYLPEFISKLKEAGIDKIIAEKQKQLDAWVEGNK